MKTCRLRIAVLFSLVALSSTASFSAIAADSCEVSQVTDSTISDRSRIVRFPDGRSITIVGHNHGDRAYPIELSRLSRSTRDEISDPSFVNKVRELLKDKGGTLKHAKEDLAYLKKQLVAEKALEFVAIEGTQEAVTENYTWMRGLKIRLASQISRRKLLASPEYDNSILLATGAPTYLSLTEPKLLQRELLVGLESKTATDAHSIALDKFDEARDRLNAVAQGDEEFLKLVRETSNEFFQIYPVYDSAAHDKIILQTARKQLPPKYLEAGMNWIRTGLVEMAAMKERDRAVTDNIISTNKSGVIFVGYLHMESIANMLQQKCRALEAISPNPAHSAEEPSSGVR